MRWSGGTSPLFNLEGVSQPGASTPAALPGPEAFSSMDILYFCNVWNADSELLSTTKPNTGTMFSSPQWESLHFQLEHVCVYWGEGIKKMCETRKEALKDTLQLEKKMLQSSM